MQREYDVLVTVKITVIAENPTLAQRDAYTIIQQAIRSTNAKVIGTET